MLPGGSEVSWVRTLLRTSPEEVRATLEGQVDPKKKDQPTSQLAGTKRAGLEGFEPPTHGPGNLHTRKWVCLSPELQAILV